MRETEITHDDYQVRYDPASATVTCRGSFQLRGSEEYAPILQLLIDAANTKPATMTLDLCQLQFLNSSGINTLAKFILQVRQHNISQVMIKGNPQFPWQQKALKNFQRLIPGLQLRMGEMEITHDDYQVRYDPVTATMTCQGSFRLRGSEEYAPILQLLIDAADAKPATMTLDLRQLQFLNSSGINTLAKFILQVRQHNISHVLIKGNPQFPWQQKSLKNFQRLLPGLQLEIE